jgi:hypothetical protein
MEKPSLFFFFILFLNLSFGQGKFKPTENYIRQSSKAFTLYNEKNFVQSAKSYDTLFNDYNGRGLRTDKYNAACAWSLAGNMDQAFYYLNQSLLTNEWVNLSNIDSDSDLISLHSDMRWQLLNDKIRMNNKVPEQKLNKPLTAALDTIYMEDQTDRNNLDIIKEKYGWQSKQMDSLWKKISHQDSINLARIKYIITTNGWLGPAKVGERGASAIFLVIQHADSLTQVTYLPIIRKAVKKGDARAQDLALLEDRVLTKQGKKQMYGSQVKIDSAGKYIFFPIKDEANVNKRRLTVGLGPLEDYAKYFGIEYVLPSKKKLSN